MASASGIVKNIGVRRIPTNKTAKLENDVERLMFYLKCALKTCGLDIIQDDLLDFNNANRLPSRRQDAVFLAAYKFSPNELLNKTMFLDNTGRVCGSKEKLFLEISDSTQMFHAQEEVLIVGARKRVSRIMVCRQVWLDKYYVRPMSRNEGRVERAIWSLSKHCGHCAGGPGNCECSRCPRRMDSQCSSMTLKKLLDLGRRLEESSRRTAELEARAARDSYKKKAMAVVFVVLLLLLLLLALATVKAVLARILGTVDRRDHP